MERRRNVRRTRHVQVRFTRRGDAQVYSGYTTDISTTGMFVTTASPLQPGERLRLELMGEGGFVIEGIVARAMRVAAHLLAVRKPGMGVRFMQVDELVAELVHISNAAAKPAVAAVTTDAPPVDGVYPVRFRDAHHFVQTFRRDIATGGLFVSTRHPAKLNDAITVELHVPGLEGEPAKLRARVVQRFEPHAGGPSNLAAGMGVELVDRTAALALLEPIARRLESDG